MLVVVGVIPPLPKVILYVAPIVVSIGPEYVTPFTLNDDPFATLIARLLPNFEMIVADERALFVHRISTTKPPRATSPVTLPVRSAGGNAGSK